MVKRILSQEEKKEILQMYNDRSITVREIVKAYNINASKLTNIILEMGGVLRRPDASTKVKTPRCSNCHKSVSLDGAKYCPYCGHDIRSEKDLIIEKLDWLYQTTVFNVSAGERDKVRDTFLEVIAYTRKEN